MAAHLKRYTRGMEARRINNMFTTEHLCKSWKFLSAIIAAEINRPVVIHEKVPERS